MKRIVLVGCSLLILICLVLTYGWMKGDFRSLLFVNKKNTCPTLQSPVSVADVTSVLYPGQLREGDYKPHGGFRFDGLNNDEVTVRAPIDAELVRVASNNQKVGVQYFMEFQTDCGLRLTFGHLLIVAPKFQSIFDQIIPAEDDSSQTHSVSPSIHVKKGEVIATGVGFKWEDGSPNTSFDFGVYERWTKNEVSKNPNWLVREEYGMYENERGLCWLDLLPVEDAKKLRALPGADYQSGKTSDYCH